MVGGKHTVLVVVCCVMFVTTCFVGMSENVGAKRVLTGSVRFTDAYGADVDRYVLGDTMYWQIEGSGGAAACAWHCVLCRPDMVVPYAQYYYESEFTATGSYYLEENEVEGEWTVYLRYMDSHKSILIDTDVADVGAPVKWAVIVDGGQIGGNQQEDFDQETVEAYTVLSGQGFEKSNICLLTPYPTFDADGDEIDDQSRVATVSNVKWAIQTWLDISEASDDVFIYFVNHGDTDMFGVSDGSVYSTSVAMWLNGAKYDRLVFVIEACMSGSWEDDLAGADRIFISSADYYQYAYPDPGTDWPAFSHTFFLELADGCSVEESFQTAYDHVLAVILHFGRPIQFPQMNDQIAGDYYP